MSRIYSELLYGFLSNHLFLFMIFILTFHFIVGKKAQFDFQGYIELNFFVVQTLDLIVRQFNKLEHLLLLMFKNYHYLFSNNVKKIFVK